MDRMRDSINQWLADQDVTRVITATVIILLIVLLLHVVRRNLVARIQSSDARYRFRKLINFIGFITAIILLLTIFSDRLGKLSVAFGVAGAGIAFALQEVIASIAGWGAISVGNFFKVGDRVQLGGIIGDVIDIGVLRTTVMEIGQWVKGDLYNGRIVRIANSFVFKEPVFNYSADFPFLWDEIVIPVKYGSDYRLTRDILQRTTDEAVGGFIPIAQSTWGGMVSKYMIEEARIEPMVTLILNDNWMEFTVRYVVDYKRRRVTKDLLFTRILEEFEQTNGRVTIASSTVHLVDAPEFRVRLEGN